MRTLLLLLMLAAPGPAWAQTPPPAPGAPRWDTPPLLMWQDRTRAQWRGLLALGFTGSKLRSTGGTIDPNYRALLREAGVPFYLENLATDFYAPYHRYTPGRHETWLMDAARDRHRAADPAAFVREPGLADPAWIARVQERLAAAVRASAADRPLFYNLADESGIADLASAWDFDVSPQSLDAFRAWLRTQYPSLDALNGQWGAAFPAWDAVAPELTDAAIRRADQNFSAWSDFKAFMDVAFAGAVRQGAAAVHAADPQALVALEGAQVPGWGGYDYALLAPTVDVMEIYDYGDSLDLALAGHPGLIALRTSFGTGPREAHLAWRHLLHGGRGTVVWDERDDVVNSDGSAGPRGRELAQTQAALVQVDRVLREARPDPDPVAVFVSQASFRVRWLLDRRAGDPDWPARDAEREYDDTAWRAARRVLLGRLGELGVHPRLVAGLEGAELQGVKLLFLPHAIAMSDAEVAAVRAFQAAGGTVLADTEPGVFDGHGRRRPTPPLRDVPHPEPVRPLGVESTPGVLDALAVLLRAAGAAPRAAFLGPDGRTATGIEARWFKGAQGPVATVQAARPWGAPPRLVLRRAGAADRPFDLDAVAPTVLRLAP